MSERSDGTVNVGHLQAGDIGDTLRVDSKYSTELAVHEA